MKKIIYLFFVTIFSFSQEIKAVFSTKNDSLLNNELQLILDNNSECFEYNFNIEVKKLLKKINIKKGEKIVKFLNLKEINKIKHNATNLISEESLTSFNVYEFEGNNFTGWATLTDTLLHLNNGCVDLIKHYKKNKIIEAYEVNMDCKNGVYLMFDDLNIKTSGTYEYGKKIRSWYYKNQRDYDCIIEAYDNTYQLTFVHYYINKRMTRYEDYKFGRLFFYWTSTFKENKEFRSFYDSYGTNYDNCILIDGHYDRCESLMKSK